MRTGRITKGICLMDLVVVLIFVAVFAVLFIPNFQDMCLKSRLNSAVHEISLILREKKIQAMSEECAVGICFESAGGDYSYRIFKDGNRNGIRRKDIADGIDFPVSDTMRLSEQYPGISFSILPAAGIPDLPPENGTLPPGGDPIRFGSDMVAFSPSGDSSSGSLFLSDGRRFMFAVKLYGPTGRIQRYRFDEQAGCWRML